jgi:hypothetical protein
MAESILCKSNMDAQILGSISQDFTEFLSVVEGIQKQTYNEYYFTELQRANLARNLDHDGKFIGEMTPVYTNPITNVQHPSILEWKPNMYGGFDLPQINLSDPRARGVEYPAACANGIQLEILEAEKDKPDSPWRHLGKRISPAMNLFRQIINLLKVELSHSVAIQDETRMPWFHRADALAIFIDNCLPLNADPLFMSTVSLITDTGNAVITNPSQEKHLVYAPLPIGRHPTTAWLKQAADIIPDSIEAGKGVGVDNFGRAVDYYVWENPITHVTVALNATAFAPKNMVLPPYALVYTAITGGQAAWYDRILNEVGAPTDELITLMNNFANRLMKIKPSKTISTALILRAIVKKLDDGANVRSVIQEFMNIKSSSDGNGTKQLMNFLKPYTIDDIPDDKFPPRFTLDDLFQSRSSSANTFAAKLSSVDLEEDSKAIRQAIYLYDLLSTLVLPNPNLDTALQSLPPLNLTSKKAFVEILRKLTGTIPFGPGTVRMTKNDGTVVDKAAAADVIAELEAAVDKIKYTIPDVLAFNTNVEQYPDEAKVTSRYLRTTLSSSAALVESLINHAVPIVKPGNPQNGFVSPLEFEDTTVDRFGRNTGNLPEDVYKRSAYLTIGQMQGKGISVDHIRYLDTQQPDYQNHHFMEEEKPRGRIASSAFDFFDTGKRRISAFMHDQEEEFPDGESYTDFKKRKDEAAYYGYSGPGKYVAPQAEEGETEEEKQEPKVPLVTRVLKHNFKKIQKMPLLFRMVCHALLMLPVNRWDVIAKLIDNNVYIPFGVTNWRPFITHQMMSLILLKRGLTTGANFFGKCNFMMQADAAVKTMIATLTFHGKSVVHGAKNVYPLEDVVPYLYMGGCNLEYITGARDLEQTGGHRKKSIICTLHPATETSLPTKASLDGFAPITEANPRYDDNNVAHYWNWGFYDDIYNFSGRTRLSLPNTFFVDASDRVNVLCFSGFAFFFNPETRQYDVNRVSKGHRGIDGNGRGVASIWNGMQKQFPKFDARQYTLV